MTSGAGYPSSYYPYIIATLVDTVPQECGGTGGQVINSKMVMVVVIVVVIMVVMVVRSLTLKQCNNQMVKIVFVVLLIMMISNEQNGQKDKSCSD